MGKKGGDSGSNDPRFSSMLTAPIFKKSRHDQQKVKLDDRFKSVLNDERFSSNVAKVDKYGRKTVKSKSAAKELSEFYEIDDKDAEETEDAPKEDKKSAETRLDYLQKLSRGEISGDSSEESSGSEEDSADESDEDGSEVESDDDDDDETNNKGALAVPEDGEVETGDATKRLAIQNCQWENLNATDLMVILQSFCPPGKNVQSVTIYPSDFGLKSMENEAKFGPQGIWATNEEQGDGSGSEMDINASDSEDEEDGEEDSQEGENDEEGSDGEGSVASKTPSEKEREKQENLEALTDVYNDLRGKKDTMSIKQLLEWEDVVNLLEQNILTREDLFQMLSDLLGVNAEKKQKTPVTLEQFVEIVAMLDEAEVENAEYDLGSDLEQGSEGEEDGSDDDIYDGVVGPNEDDMDSAAELSDESDSEQKVSKKSIKKDAKGDFKRKKGNVGIILQDDLVELGKAEYEPEDDENETADPFQKKTKKQTSDYNEIALRKYELLKLRYYFAIVVCDDVDTANTLYTQLDNVEFENTSMTLDLRFVPDDIDFTGRQVKNTCTTVAHNYKPPEFVINALQHTKLQCSWDEGEKDRERKLTNISSWRNLNQSELQQYIASDSESDDSDDAADQVSTSGSDSDASNPKKKSKKAISKSKSKKANKLRALLNLGGSDNSDHESNASEDDFFAKGSDEEGSAEGSEAEDFNYRPDEEGEKFMTFMPKDKDSEKNAKKAKETPYEEQQRKTAEKKALKKLTKKEQAKLAEKEKADLKNAKNKGKNSKNSKKNQSESEESDEQSDYDDDSDNLISDSEQVAPSYGNQKIASFDNKVKNTVTTVSNVATQPTGKQLKTKYVGKNGPLYAAEGEDETQEAQQKRKEQLELLFAGEEEDMNEGDDKLTYDLKAMAKEQRQKEKKAKRGFSGGKRNGSSKMDVDEDAPSSAANNASNFKLDLKDDRFSALFEGSAKYGIDMTASEFKETQGIKEILQEQQRKRKSNEKKAKKASSSSAAGSGSADVSADMGAQQQNAKEDVNKLANKLKRKFASSAK